MSKFVTIVNGRQTLESSIDTSVGAASQGRIPELDASGRLDNSMMPVGIGADTTNKVASENLAAGNYVNIWNDAGVAKVRKADASVIGKECNGFVLEGAAEGAIAMIYFEGRNTQLTGLTPGARYYLSDTLPGGVTLVPVTAEGHIHQYLGVAVSDTEINFEATDAITM
jgi:hypothetical protein